MRRTLAILAAAGLAFSGTPAAWAYFVVGAAPTVNAPAPVIPSQIRPGPGVVADIPHAGPADRRPRAAIPVRRRVAPPPVVQGFGDEVPLAFACRQILPASIKVAYGPGTDPGMIVSWKGGDTWPRVLAAAIKPLGLHLRRSGNTVTIES